MFLSSIKPHPGNINDSGLLREAATILRKAALDLDAMTGRGETIYSSDAFEEARNMIDEAVWALEGAAMKAEDNAVDDAIGEATDIARERAEDFTREDD